MAVYVDDAKHAYGRMLMCHMVGDTEPELHALADRLGIKRAWFHRGHYNICQVKRERAIRLGATAITSRQAAKIRASL